MIEIINDKIDNKYLKLRQEFHKKFKNIFDEDFNTNEKILSDIINLIKWGRRKNNLQYLGSRDTKKLIIMFDRAFKFQFNSHDKCVIITVYDTNLSKYGRCMREIYGIKKYNLNKYEYNKIEKYIKTIHNEIINFGPLKLTRKEYNEFKLNLKNSFNKIFNSYNNNVEAELKKLEIYNETINFYVDYKFKDDNVANEIYFYIEDITTDDIVINIIHDNSMESYFATLKELIMSNNGYTHYSRIYEEPFNMDSANRKISKILYEINKKIKKQRLDCRKIYGKYNIGYYNSDGILNYMSLYDFILLDRHWVFSYDVYYNHRYIIKHLSTYKHDVEYTNKFPSDKNHYNYISNKNTKDIIIFEDLNITNY